LQVPLDRRFTLEEAITNAGSHTKLDA